MNNGGGDVSQQSHHSAVFMGAAMQTTSFNEQLNNTTQNLRRNMSYSEK